MPRLAPLALALLRATTTSATIQLDFSTASIVHSNLGGEGPDGGEERIMFEGVGSLDGTSLDLEVREVAVEGNDYIAHNTESTMINGDFGQINMKADREATFEFCFLYADSGELAVLEEFGYVRGAPARAPPPSIPPPPLLRSPCSHAQACVSLDVQVAGRNSQKSAL